MLLLRLSSVFKIVPTVRTETVVSSQIKWLIMGRKVMYFKFMITFFPLKSLEKLFVVVITQ